VGVRQLVRQAEGLKVLLDELAERMSRDLLASVIATTHPEEARRAMTA
jgi:hypothetical protein